jgi:hypothetical protein
MNRCLAVNRSRNRLAFRTASSSDGFHHIRTPAPVKTTASGPYKLPSHDSSPARRTTVKQEKMAFWGPRLPSNSKSADCQLRRSRSQVGEITLRAFQKHDANQAVGRPWTLEKNGGNFIPRSMMSKPPYGGAKPERASAGIFYRLSSHSFTSNAVHVAHPRQPISGKPSRLFSAFSQKFPSCGNRDCFLGTPQSHPTTRLFESRRALLGPPQSTRMCWYGKGTGIMTSDWTRI